MPRGGPAKRREEGANKRQPVARPGRSCRSKGLRQSRGARAGQQRYRRDAHGGRGGDPARRNLLRRHGGRIPASNDPTTVAQQPAAYTVTFELNGATGQDVIGMDIATAEGASKTPAMVVFIALALACVFIAMKLKESKLVKTDDI